MGEYVVIRAKPKQDKTKEYRTKNGTWSSRKSDAFLVSEEDAKAIVRTVTIADHPPALYTYDHENA